MADSRQARIARHGRMFLRIGAVSGFTAVIMGAYGAHVLKTRSGIEHEITTFDSANKYHLIHSLALLAVPLTRQPLMTGSLMTAGILGFCGTGYYYSMTSDATPVKLMPIGGLLLMAGWLAMAL
ncbi:transmembrane protein 256 homolog [Lytechinus variegatus]|uniref:transmembrane protein 256 homolog n=1 Tax=Lytechinus variegatus TaxID=7654 RepID=UPI001BB1F889|nr:transmembrane protein 256 homolog [Lytechinus variegatus]